MTDRIHELMERLQVDFGRLEAREMIEGYVESEVERALRDLAGIEEIAAAWGVTPRRARQHLTRLHEERGAGHMIGGSWVLRRTDIEKYRPGPPGRPRRDEEESV